MGRRLAVWQARRHHHHRRSSPAEPSFSSCFTYSLHLHKQHSTLCSPPLAPSRTRSYQLIQGCTPHALRSCALVEEWFPRPLLATAKLPAVFYATAIVASGSRKRLRSLSSTPQNKNSLPKHRYPTHDQAFSLLPQQHQILSLTSNVFAMKAAGV